MAAYRPGRSKAKEWDLFEEIEDPNKVRCKQCETEVSKKIERVRVHLEKCRNSKRRRDDAEDEQDVEEPTTAPKLDKWVVRTTGAMKKKLDEQYARGIYAAQCIAQLADEEIKRCEKEYGCTVVGYISDNEAKMVAELRLLDPDRHQTYFRMSRDPFDLILSKIGPLITRQHTNFREPIEPAQRLAITLRVVNISAHLLRDHGPDYVRWARGLSSIGGPLEVARAAMVMPPPFFTPPGVLWALAVPLLEKGLVTLEALSAGRRRDARRLRELEVTVADANSRISQLESAACDLQLQRSEAALHRRVDRLTRELGVAAQQHRQLVADNEGYLTRLEQAAKLSSQQHEELSRITTMARAVKQNPALSVTEKDIANAIGKWLVNSRDREGYRTARQATNSNDCGRRSAPSSNGSGSGNANTPVAAATVSNMTLTLGVVLCQCGAAAQRLTE
ncbi:hypothetical protein FJT64_002121 [Amphibalanus amphitrite]|uniref:BED-type domain-containing protein n=1 Tax=Amphibalanus amphitrite TaxID=1232801 RepID=A0A6A4WN23_AMPAM|nr:hypothetical protein FJT64_002121 [Amphibalanus amphitrite]